jgi:DNA-binding MarR family transcriptional regulator
MYKQNNYICIEMNDKKATYCSCMFYSANALARVLTKMAEEEFAITGLAPSYSFLLMTVNNNDGIQPMDISEIMQLTPSTVTRLVEKMEQKKYVKRESKGKSTFVYITEKGKKIDSNSGESVVEFTGKLFKQTRKRGSKAITSDIYNALEKLDL